MSYTTVYGVLKGIVEGVGLSQSQETAEFKSEEFGTQFMLNCVSGSNQSTLNDRLHDEQVWEIKIAISKSEFNDLTNRDELHRKRVEIIKAVDNPANWQSSVRVVQYDSWEFEETDNHFVITIAVRVSDVVSY